MVGLVTWLIRWKNLQTLHTKISRIQINPDFGRPVFRSPLRKRIVAEVTLEFYFLSYVQSTIYYPCCIWFTLRKITWLFYWCFICNRNTRSVMFLNCRFSQSGRYSFLYNWRHIQNVTSSTVWRHKFMNCLIKPLCLFFSCEVNCKPGLLRSPKPHRVCANYPNCGSPRKNWVELIWSNRINEFW